MLLTVQDCEFLSCFSYLDKPMKSYHKDIGFVFFGGMGGNGQEKLKVALLKCSKSFEVPGGPITAVKNVGRILHPKAVFSVGTCSGLTSDKAKLGDVVLSAKLTTSAFKTPVSRDIGNLIRHASDGWTAPLENPDEQQVRVYYDANVLSLEHAARFQGPYEDIISQFPDATVFDTEGQGKSLVIIQCQCANDKVAIGRQKCVFLL